MGQQAVLGRVLRVRCQGRAQRREGPAEPAGLKDPSAFAFFFSYTAQEQKRDRWHGLPRDADCRG